MAPGPGLGGLGGLGNEQRVLPTDEAGGWCFPARCVPERGGFQSGSAPGAVALTYISSTSKTVKTGAYTFQGGLRTLSTWKTARAQAGADTEARVCGSA